MPLWATVYFFDECGYNIWTARNHGRARQGERACRRVCGKRGRNVTVALAVPPVNGLVFHSAYIGGMNAPRFNAFLAQTSPNLDPDEKVIFIYDGAPAHRNPAIPAANTELEMLLAYSPFLNIVGQAISSLKAAMKGDISRPSIGTLFRPQCCLSLKRSSLMYRATIPLTVERFTPNVSATNK